MSLLKLVYLPDRRLRTVCKQVQEEEIKTVEFQRLIDDMIETMYAEHGVGLAANQVGICKRFTVIDASPESNQPFCIINPEIIERGDEMKMDEGCLSVPGCYDQVLRPTYIKVRALDRHGQWIEVEGRDLLAEILDHEIDHLNGKLFIDKLSVIRRQRATQKMQRHLRAAKHQCTHPHHHHSDHDKE